MFALTAALLGARFNIGPGAGLTGIPGLPGLRALEGTIDSDMIKTGESAKEGEAGSALGSGGGEYTSIVVPAGCNMGRRRSRAVLYQLSGHYRPEKGVKTKLKLNNVNSVNGDTLLNRTAPSSSTLLILTIVDYLVAESVAYRRGALPRIQNSIAETLSFHFAALWRF